jgi:hypothetical protein
MAYDNSFVDVAKVSLWVKESKAGKRFLSGTITFNDGTKVNISLFHNDDKKHDKSPEFWGKLSATEDRLGDKIILEAEEDGSAKKRQAPKKQESGNDFF